MANDIIRNYMRYLKLERNYTYNTLEAYRHDLEYLIDYARQNDVALVDMKLETWRTSRQVFTTKASLPALRLASSVVCAPSTVIW